MKLLNLNLYGDAVLLILFGGLFLLPTGFLDGLEQETMIQLAAAVSMTAVAFILLLRRNQKLIFNKSECALFLLLAAIIIVSLFSHYPVKIIVYKTGMVLGVFMTLKTVSKSADNRHLFVTIVLIGVCEALYEITLHKHSDVGIAVHFDNPSGFAAFMVMLLPFAVRLISFKKLFFRIFGISSAVILLIGVVLSDSRAGLISVTLLTLAWLVRLGRRFMKSLPRNLKWGIYAALAIALMAEFSFLYGYKKNSADGRILIWKCSGNMVAVKPFFGHGANSFQAEYMLYQAAYFEKHPDSKFAKLADNVKHPFNEYLGFLIQYGIVGTFILSLLLLLILKNGIKRGMSEEKFAALLSLAGVMVFGLFSYPLYYTAVLIIIAVDLSIISRSGEGWSYVKEIPFPKLLALILPLACMFLIGSVRAIKNECKWGNLKNRYLYDEKAVEKYRYLHETRSFSRPSFLYNYGAVLNKSGLYAESTIILDECMRQLNDVDLQVLQADNNHQIGNYVQAEECAGLAHKMCPGRFIPLYQLVLIYDHTGRKEEALRLAHEIIEKPIKVPSSSIIKIRRDMKDFIESSNESVSEF